MRDAKDLLTVASAVVVALSLVTGLVGIQVGAWAAGVLLGQGLYALFHRTSSPPPLGDHAARARASRAASSPAAACSPNTAPWNRPANAAATSGTTQKSHS